MADGGEESWAPVPEGTTYEDMLLRNDWEWLNIRNLDDQSIHTVPRLGAIHTLTAECWCKPVPDPRVLQFTHNADPTGGDTPIQTKYLN